jgi:phage-related protein
MSVCCPLHDVSLANGCIGCTCTILACYTKFSIIQVREKRIIWVGSVLEDVRAFPPDVRRRIGYELHQIQQGLTASDWKPMPAVGGSVTEVRIHVSGEHRLFYVARFEEAIYVLHAFAKKTAKTSKRDLDLARSRLREVIAQR